MYRNVFHATLIALPLSIAIGSACALFLWSLEVATRTRFEHPWLVYLLPLAGVVIVAIYRSVGRSAEAGTNLILDEIHEPRAGVPRRMAPLILISTVVTHLFGGSAGREGTAVQIGGSVASTLGKAIDRRLGWSLADGSTLMRIGIAAGFGGVFGTPAAGAVFALEVVLVRRRHLRAVLPCIVAATIGHLSCIAWGVHHTAYPVVTAPRWIDARMLALACVIGLAAAVASRHFVWLTHNLNHLWKRLLPGEILAPIVGGAVVIGLAFVVGSRDYLGLGVVSDHAGGVSIVSSFLPGGADALSWWWKIVFTAVTLSCGFKGGEVTPLFFIGATLGNVLSRYVDGSTDACAAMGFVAVFAAATKTPLACAVMAIELFGPSYAAAFLAACCVANAAGARTGVYATQRGRAKI